MVFRICNYHEILLTILTISSETEAQKEQKHAAIKRYLVSPSKKINQFHILS